MENQEATPNNLAQVNAMFANYRTAQTAGKKKTSEEILAKYFEPRKTKEYFRILPPKAGNTYFEEAYFHVIDTMGSGGKLKRGNKIYCPAHNNPKVPKLNPDGSQATDPNGKVIMVAPHCPICEKAQKMLKTQNLSIKGITKEQMNDTQKAIYDNNRKIFIDAGKFEAKKFYVLRGIDKGAEKDGVKFWRFKFNYKNQGTYDKLIPVLQDFVEANQVDFTDPVFGTDLNITMADSEFMGHTYKSISAITTKGKSPLNSDSIVVRQWLEDNITWREVYTPKKAKGIDEHRYLELVAEGNAPYWDNSDNANKHWVFPNHPELEAAANTRNANFDADDSDDDVDEDNISETKTQNFDSGTNLGSTVLQSRPVDQKVDIKDDAADSGEYGDLPF